MVIVLMGVSGAGKTTVGRLLADQFAWQFVDGDDYHSAENVKKMRSGIPLTDADRAPWLAKLRALVAEWLTAGTNAVLACSALKGKYRDQLRIGEDVKFVYLRGSPEILRQRLHERSGHFMTEGMLASQLEALEEPSDAIVVDIGGTTEEVVAQLRAKLQLP